MILDRAQLRNITMEDEDLMREIVEQLVHDASRQIQALREAYGKADSAECARLAHSARGACGNVGASSLAALFSVIEKHALSGELARCRGEVESLAPELERLKIEAAGL